MPATNQERGPTIGVSSPPRPARVCARVRARRVMGSERLQPAAGRGGAGRSCIRPGLHARTSATPPTGRSDAALCVRVGYGDCHHDRRCFAALRREAAPFCRANGVINASASGETCSNAATRKPACRHGAGTSAID